LSGPYALMAEGERLAGKGLIREATERFEAAHKQAPKDARVLLRLASAIASDDPAGALRAAQRATKLAPGSAAAHTLRAKYALLSGDPATAHDAARRALELAPGNGMASTLTHLAAGMRGDYPAALAGLVRDGIFEQSDVTALAMECFLKRWTAEGPACAPLPELPIPKPTDPVERRTDGGGTAAVRDLHAAYGAGDPIGMLQALAELRPAQPQHEDVAAGYAAALHQCGRNDLAEPWARRALDEQRAAAKRAYERRSQGLLARVGRALSRRGAPKPPAEGFDPEPEGLILAGWIYLGLGDLKVARKLAERGSRTVNPFDRWEARLVLALCDLLSNRRREALAELRTAVAEEPMTLYLWFHRAALLPTMQAMSRSIAAARAAGDEALERALRIELGQISANPARPKGSRALKSALAQTRVELGAEDLDLLRGYAELGLEAVKG